MRHLPDEVVHAGRSAVVLGGLVLTFGLAVSLAGGYLNQYPQFRPYFLALGIGGFVAPGTLSLIGGVGLLRRQPLGWLATTGGIWQALVGLALTGVQFGLSPISAVPIVLTTLWTVAACWSAVLAVRGGRSVRNARPGFVVEPA